MHGGIRKRLFFTANAVGAICIAVGLSLPVYTDRDRATELKLNSCHGGEPVGGWYAEMEALETLRHPLMQGGISLILAALTIWWLWTKFGSRNSNQLRTPSSRWMYVALGLGVVVLSWFSQMWSLDIDARRGVFPTCADSIAIPMYYISIATAALLIPTLCVAFLLTLGFRQLPVTLFAWNRFRPSRSTLVTIPFALLSLLLLLVGVLQSFGSAFIGTPAIVVALYLTEATRSALLAEGSS